MQECFSYLIDHISRAVRNSGISFKDKIPYELQGNVAIEDIKEYY